MPERSSQRNPKPSQFDIILPFVWLVSTCINHPNGWFMTFFPPDLLGLLGQGRPCRLPLWLQEMELMWKKPPGTRANMRIEMSHTHLYNIIYI